MRWRGMPGVVFLRGAAPDEEVEAVIREEHRAFAFADTVAVLRPSAQRRLPPCQYLPSCGGCPWQHLSYAAQLLAKQRTVEQHLRRIAGLDVAVAPVIASPHEFGGRRRIKLRVERGAVGYYAAASHTLVPIAHCLLAEPAVDAAIDWARELVGALDLPLRRVELVGCGSGNDRVVVIGEVSGGWADAADTACREWLMAHPVVQGLALHGRGWQRRWGDVQSQVEPEAGLSLTAHAPAFTQVNPAVNRRLVETVVRWVDPQPGQRVLDLYAGIGNLSLPMRRRGAVVVAVEHAKQAAADAAANGERSPGPAFRVIGDRAERAVERFAHAGERFDAVVLDPPRSGAAGCLPALLRLARALRARCSCDPLRQRWRAIWRCCARDIGSTPSNRSTCSPTPTMSKPPCSRLCLARPRPLVYRPLGVTGRSSRAGAAAREGARHEAHTACRGVKADGQAAEIASTQGHHYPRARRFPDHQLPPQRSRRARLAGGGGPQQGR
jgi:23S rRNA (uracil1939-C5)-methyltransferase